VQLQSKLLTLLEKEIESCVQVIFSLRMKQTVIQPYFDVALYVVHHDDEYGLQMLRSVPRSIQYTRRYVYSIRRDERLTVSRIFGQRYLPIALTETQRRKNL
jgi:hypothetical protein